MSEHTPTPYRRIGNRIYSNSLEVAVATHADPAVRKNAEFNAEFIVRACNTYDELIGALALAKRYGPSCFDPEDYARISSVLAKAGA